MVYAQGGAIASPSTADTDQPTAWMSSATACMQASGSRLMPSAIASHSAHRHRSSGGLARRLRGGFMPPRYEGGTTFSGARAGRPARRPPDSVPRVKWLAEPSAEALREALKPVAPELSPDRDQFGTNAAQNYARSCLGPHEGAGRRCGASPGGGRIPGLVGVDAVLAQPRLKVGHPGPQPPELIRLRANLGRRAN